MQGQPTLIMVYRVEPGCLGPDGAELVDGFCAKANASFRAFRSGAVHFLILPRRDTTQPETQFRLLDKNLPRDKAQIVLDKLGIDIDEFEEQVGDRIAQLIEEFFGR